jgi:1-acyl-sn-glycerol-3-phosphate acyltransferase
LLRRHLNAVVVALGLGLALPAIAVAERVRPRLGGRAVARRAVRALQWCCGLRVETAGPPPTGPSVVVPNHLSLLDVPVLLSAMGEVPRFVAAAELFRVPLLRSALRALDVVELDRRRPAVARRQLDALTSIDPLAPLDSPIVVFAQGAIPEPGEVLPFQTGAFVLAIDLGVPVVPVAIWGTDRRLPRGRRFGVTPGAVSVRFLAPIATDGLTRADRKLLRDRTQQAVVAA